MNLRTPTASIERGILKSPHRLGDPMNCGLAVNLLIASWACFITRLKIHQLSDKRTIFARIIDFADMNIVWPLREILTQRWSKNGTARISACRPVSRSMASG